MNPNENENENAPYGHQPGLVINPNQPPEQFETTQPAPAPSEPLQAPAAEPAYEPVTSPEPSVSQPEYQAQPAQQVPEQQFQAQPVQQVPEQQPVAEAPQFAAATPNAVPVGETSNENQDKNYVLALALSYFFGGLGVDRFYLGKVGTGIAKLLTFGGLGIWALIDIFLIAFGKLRAAGDDRPLQGFAHNFHWVKITAIILVIVNVLFVGLLLALIIMGTIAGVQQESRLQQYNTSVQNQSITSDTVN